jgi:hypothetical protein
MEAARWGALERLMVLIMATMVLLTARLLMDSPVRLA